VVVLDELVVFLLCTRIAIVSSKTKESRKVFTLHLSREALLKKTLSKNSKHTWKVLSLSLSLSLPNFCLLATLFAVLSKVNQISTSGLQTAGGVRNHLKRRCCCHHARVLPRWLHGIFESLSKCSGLLKVCPVSNTVPRKN
jgi:hypothetical protein